MNLIQDRSPIYILLAAFVAWFWVVFSNMSGWFYVTQLAGEAIKGLEDLERNQELKLS